VVTASGIAGVCVCGGFAPRAAPSKERLFVDKKFNLGRSLKVLTLLYYF